MPLHRRRNFFPGLDYIIPRPITEMTPKTPGGLTPLAIIMIPTVAWVLDYRPAGVVDTAILGGRV